MRNLFFLACILSILSFSGYCAAQESELKEQVAQIQTEEEKAVAEDGLEEDNVVEELDLSQTPETGTYVEKIPTVKLPDCNNDVLIALVSAKVAEYYMSHPAENILEKRRQALLLKNLRAFDEVAPAGFTSKQNYNVANHLLMTKINLGLDDNEVKLCKNAGYGNASDIYLLIYPQNFQAKVSILNLTQNQQEDFSVIYPNIF